MQCPPPPLQTLHARGPRLVPSQFGCIATLAVFYSVAYFWLAINPTRGGEWSAFLRPFGALTWISTWSVPPLVIVKERRLRAADLEEKLGKRIQRLDYILEEGDVRG